MSLLDSPAHPRPAPCCKMTDGGSYFPHHPRPASEWPDDDVREFTPICPEGLHIALALSLLSLFSHWSVHSYACPTDSQSRITGNTEQNSATAGLGYSQPPLIEASGLQYAHQGLSKDPSSTCRTNTASSVCEKLQSPPPGFSLKSNCFALVSFFSCHYFSCFLLVFALFLFNKSLFHLLIIQEKLLGIMLNASIFLYPITYLSFGHVGTSASLSPHPCCLRGTSLSAVFHHSGFSPPLATPTCLLSLS